MHSYSFCSTWFSSVNASIVLDDCRGVVSEIIYLLHDVLSALLNSSHSLPDISICHLSLNIHVVILHEKCVRYESVVWLLWSNAGY